jgi:hypothetical protein
MLTHYTIIDCRSASLTKPLSITGRTPEEAAKQALSLELKRGGHPKDLVCRVYWQDGETKTMVRLYR